MQAWAQAGCPVFVLVGHLGWCWPCPSLHGRPWLRQGSYDARDALQSCNEPISDAPSCGCPSLTRCLVHLLALHPSTAHLLDSLMY